VAATHLMLAAVMKTQVSIDNFPVHSNLIGFHCNNTAAEDEDHAPKNQLKRWYCFITVLNPSDWLVVTPTERVVSSHTF